MTAMTITTGIGNVIDASQYGVVPGKDCTAAFQDLVDSAPNGTTIQLPPGHLNVTAQINFTSAARLQADKKNSHVKLRGCGSDVTHVVGNFAGPVVGRNVDESTGTGSAYISGIDFINGDPAGICLQLEALNRSVIRECSFQGNAGLVIGKVVEWNEDVGIYDCDFYGDTVQFPHGVGCSVRMSGALYSCSGYNWGDCALQLADRCSLYHGRFEVNNTAIRTGAIYGGAPYGWYGTLDSLHFEANLRHVSLWKPTSGAFISSANVFGDVQWVGDRPGQWPVVGIELMPGVGSVTVSNTVVGGSFQDCAMKVDCAGPLILSNVQANNKGQAGSSANWKVTTPKDSMTCLQTVID